MRRQRRTRRGLPVLLEAHRAAMVACRDCGHREGIVPIAAADSRAPRAMIVGQAPGITEAGGGRPFAGRAGATLFRWLARAGLDEQAVRRHVYIAALTRCYPGRAASGRGDRVPGPEEMARCARWLDAELALIQPSLLIPIGRLAITRFLPPKPLDQLVGTIHEVAHAGGASRVVPLPHPSGASSWFHMPANARLLDRAVQHIGRELRGLDIGRYAPRRTVA